MEFEKKDKEPEKVEVAPPAEAKPPEKAALAEPAAPAAEAQPPDALAELTAKVEANQKAIEDVLSRMSIIEEAIDAATKEEEGETPPEANQVEMNPPGPGGEKKDAAPEVASYSKDFAAMKADLTEIKSTIAQFANSGMKKTIPSGQKETLSPTSDMDETFKRLHI